VKRLWIVPAAGLVLSSCDGAGAGGPERHRDPPEVSTASGLRYVDLKDGDGRAPAPGQTAVLHYTGSLADGKVFDSSMERGAPYRFVLGRRQVIRGLEEGIATMKAGGRRRLVIPADLGYGTRGRPPAVPPEARLTFEVELLAVEGLTTGGSRLAGESDDGKEEGHPPR